jgi:hypothetical protein
LTLDSVDRRRSSSFTTSARYVILPLLDGDGDASGDGEGDSVTLNCGIASFDVFSSDFRGDESSTTWMEGSIPGSATGAGKGVSTTTDGVLFSPDTADNDVMGD